MNNSYRPGDWVKSGMPSDENLHPFQLTESNWTEDVYHWKPQSMEWCVFYNNNHRKDAFRVAQYSHQIKDGRVMSTDTRLYDHCEPFIGNLPSICK